MDESIVYPIVVVTAQLGLNYTAHNWPVGLLSTGLKCGSVLLCDHNCVVPEPARVSVVTMQPDDHSLGMSTIRQSPSLGDD